MKQNFSGMFTMRINWLDIADSRQISDIVLMDKRQKSSRQLKCKTNAAMV